MAGLLGCQVSHIQEVSNNQKDLGTTTNKFTLLVGLGMIAS